MVEQKIKELQGTKTIIHIDNPDHYDLIMPHTNFFNINFRGEVKEGNFCLRMNGGTFTWSTLDKYKSFYEQYKSYKIITSTELIGNNTYELW